MPTRIALTFGEDKSAGVANIRRNFTRFMTDHSWELAPTTIAKGDLDSAFGEIWDTMKSPGLLATIRAAITSDVNLADDEQVAVMVILTVLEILNQYRAQLPGGTGDGP